VGEPTVVVGVATKAHGIRGEVAIQVRSDNPDRWRVGSVVFDEGGRRFSIEAARGSGSRLFVRFEGIDDRATAESLRGRTFVVPVTWLPPLPEGEYWPHQLEGSEVLTESGRLLGVLTDVMANPANDLWVAVDADGNETLVPAISEVVRDVDLEGKRVVVADLPGLTVPDDA
jgi:16S rRNA processing protein RimM